MGFKPQKEYRHVPKKTTASSSGNKKKCVEPIIEVRNSNPFDVLNSVDNDGEFDTNSSNTPIGEKIDKIERQICEGKLRLLDDDGDPLFPTGIVESDSEVEVVFDKTANLRISTSGKDRSDKGYGTNSFEDYDEEREMEPRPEPTRAATPPLRIASPRIRGRPLEEAPRGNGGQSGNLPLLLAAYLGRGKNGQPLQSSQTSIYGGQALPTNIGGNLPSNEDYPLPDGLKMPSDIGSYDGKGDLDNFLHLFEGAIRMQKWLMPVACHMFAYTLKDSARIWWNSQKAGLMEKTYIWVEAREVATNGALGDRIDSSKRSKKSSWDYNKGKKNKDIFSPYRGPNHGLLPNLSKSPKEILATEKSARSFEPPPKVFERMRSRDMSKYCHFYEDYGHDTNDCKHLRIHIQEAVNSGQLSHLVKGIKRKEQSHLTSRKEKVKG
ncbi:hypothetical protein Tco_0984149 [Tanacetum coccineum]